jgi:hypothetical protein
LYVQARTLLELSRAFYTDGDDYKMVLDFNHNSTAFDFDALVRKLGIQVNIQSATPTHQRR